MPLVLAAAPINLHAVLELGHAQGLISFYAMTHCRFLRSSLSWKVGHRKGCGRISEEM
jgi:hypothetical protein